MSILKNRVVAVVAGAAVVGVLSTTGAVAARMIDGGDIKNGSITSRDVKNRSLTWRDLSPGTKDRVRARATKKSVQRVNQRVKAINGFEPMVAQLDEPKTITNIGGPINDNKTDLETGLTLPAGDYLVEVSGAFVRNEAATSDVAIYPQLSLWVNKNGDDEFTWKEEGPLSPNTLMPVELDRHISVSGTTVLTLDKETEVGLLAFGYAADQSSTGSGEIDVIDAVLTATPIG